jgi:membrane protein YdbS with pleckstrin-like domain
MHEVERQTAARKKRKTLYPHIILLTEGRLFCLMAAAVPGAILFAFHQESFYEGVAIWQWVLWVLFALVMTAGCVYVLHWLWPQCFGEVTLTEDYVKWHALFMRSVKIPYSELRHVEIRQFREGNVMWGSDMYHTGYEFVLMSADPLPKTRIDKIRPGHGVIKFQLFGRMNAPLGAFIPEPFDRMFRTRAEIYAREKRAMARDWQKWKAKRKKAREKRRKKRQAEK